MKKNIALTRAAKTALEQVERYRLKKLEHYKKAKRDFWLVCLAVFMLTIWLCAINIEFLAGMLIAGPLFIMLTYTYAVQKHKKEYRHNFKAQAVHAIVRQQYPQVEYRQDAFVNQSSIKASMLFENPKKEQYYQYKGEDHFSGSSKQNNPFEFSELEIRHKKGNTDKKIFKGLFFCMEVNTQTACNVFVLPDKNEKSLGKLATLIQKSIGAYFKGSKMVYMQEYPEFEEAFVVYSNSKAEAFRLLSPTMIDTLYAFHQQWKLPIYTSFANNKIYLAIENTYDFFEADIHDSVLSDSFLHTLYEELEQCFAVIEDIVNIEQLPANYDPSSNWTNSAYKHLLNSDDAT